MSEDAEKIIFDKLRGGGLRRELFTAENMRLYAEFMAKAGGHRAMDPEKREASRREALASCAPGDDIWVFGYGSLMWNPAMHVAESRKACVRGFRRRFCLKLDMGRGTPDNPGLMLGLDAGEGAECAGMAHRIAAQNIESETQILWHRELLTGAYHPQWLDADLDGHGQVRVLAFVINRDHPRYEGEVAEDEIVRRIAASEGIIGTNRDYLYRTARHLAELGIDDAMISRLEARVRAAGGEPDSKP